MPVNDKQYLKDPLFKDRWYDKIVDESHFWPTCVDTLDESWYYEEDGAVAQRESSTFAR